MVDAVKRKYRAPRRAEQAARTRAAILDAARQSFLGQGYAATTVPAIASAASVSVETIYKVFGNKAGLLKAVFDVAVVGDVEPVAMLQRDRVARMREESDPRRVLELYGEHVVESAPRSVPVQLVVKAAAAADPGVAAVWQQMTHERLTGMTAFAQDLHDRGHLRADVSVEQARDVLWAYTAPEWYELLVMERGWTAARFGDWVVSALTAALLPRAAG